MNCVRVTMRRALHLCRKRLDTLCSNLLALTAVYYQKKNSSLTFKMGLYWSNHIPGVFAGVKQSSTIHLVAKWGITDPVTTRGKYAYKRQKIVTWQVISMFKEELKLHVHLYNSSHQCHCFKSFSSKIIQAAPYYPTFIFEVFVPHVHYKAITLV